MPLGGGTVTTVVPCGFGVGTIAVDSSFAYYTANGADLYKIPKAGGTAVALALPGGSSGSEKPLVLDATYAYWSTGDGTVRKCAK